MRRGLVRALLVAGTTVVAATSASAADCEPLKLAAAVQTQSLGTQKRMGVPVTVNGAKRLFLLDTAAPISMLFRKSAADLSLPKGPAYDSVTVEEFGIGNVGAKNAVLVLSGPLPPIGGVAYDGVLSPDLLLNYDLDLDFANGTLKLFSRDHCPGNVVYWAPPAINSLPLSDAPLPDHFKGPAFRGGKMIFKDPSHLTIPVTLDGQQLDAWIDTRDPTSYITDFAAKRVFGFKPGTSDWPAVGPYHQHTFSKLSLDGVNITNLKMDVLPQGRNADTARKRLRGDGDFSAATTSDYNDTPEMTLGMDVLKHLHMFIAYGEKKLYFSVSDATAAQAQTPPVIDLTAWAAAGAKLEQASKRCRAKYPQAETGASNVLDAFDCVFPAQVTFFEEINYRDKAAIDLFRARVRSIMARIDAKQLTEDQAKPEWDAANRDLYQGLLAGLKAEIERNPALRAQLMVLLAAGSHQ